MTAGTEKSNGPSWTAYRYAGWIPTTTGHLSFSAIGTDRLGVIYGTRSWNRRGLEFPKSESGIPDIFAYQWRPNPEFGIIRRTLSALIGSGPLATLGDAGEQLYRTGRDFWFPAYTTSYFIMAGKTGSASTPLADTSLNPNYREDQIGCLSGKVWVVNKLPQAKWLDWWRFSRLLSELTECRYESKVSQRHFKEKWIALAKFVRDYGSKVNFYEEVNFVLFRTGEIRIGLECDRFGESIFPKNNQPYNVHQQVFYFLKDVCHRHHHHRPDADQGLRLVAASSDDDTSWRRQTLWDLAKASGKLRRERSSLLKRREALGVSAYAEAFQYYLTRHYRKLLKFVPNSELATYEFGFQQRSIGASNDTAAFRRQGIAGMLLAIVAFLVSFASVYHAASSIVSRNAEVCILDPAWRWQFLSYGLGVFVIFYNTLYSRESWFTKSAFLAKNFAIAAVRFKSRLTTLCVIFIIQIFFGWILGSRWGFSFPSINTLYPFAC